MIAVERLWQEREGEKEERLPVMVNGEKKIKASQVPTDEHITCAKC